MLAFKPATDRRLQLLDALHQAAITTKTNGEIVDWSRSAEELYGWKRPEAMGRNIVDITPSTLSRDDAIAIMTALGRGEIWSGEFPVRTRAGETFVASVTDVPIADDSGQIVGVVGISAPSRGPAALESVLVRFSAACEAIWPDRVHVAFPHIGVSVPASEPHILQLLSLILIRHVGELDAGTRIDLVAAPATESVFECFGIRSQRPYVYIRLGGRTDLPSYSLLRDEISAARPANFAAALVRVVGGWLFAGAESAHLLLPVDS